MFVGKNRLVGVGKKIFVIVNANLLKEGMGGWEKTEQN